MDTSVAVALVVGDHLHHLVAMEAVEGRAPGLAGHAAFETFSVLTRLPPPARRPAHVVARLLGANFPETRFLSSEATGILLRTLEAGGIGGSAVYDALVGAAAAEHALRLLTLDRRAVDTYRAVGCDVEVLRAP